jgi:hypothetical protein
MSDKSPFQIGSVENLVADQDFYFPSEHGFSVGEACDICFTLSLKSARFMVQESADSDQGWTAVAVIFDNLGAQIPTGGWIASTGETSLPVRLSPSPLSHIRVRVRFLTGDNLFDGYAKRG